MNLEENILSRMTKTQKLFKFQLGHCSYQNTQSYRKKRISGQDHQVKIFNKICKQHDKELVKYTQIEFRDKIVRIQDVFRFHSQPNQDASSTDRSTGNTNSSSDGSQGNNNADNEGSKFPKKKKLIFKKKFIIGDKSICQMERRNTKNIAKNFCRAFIAHLQEEREKVLLQKTKAVIEKYRFNNRTIQKISTDENIAPQFRQFLVTKAEEWINASKINDKDIHKEAIKLYLELMEKSVGIIDIDNDNSEQFEMDSKSNYQSDQLFEEEDQPKEKMCRRQK